MATEITTTVITVLGSLAGVWLGGSISRKANRELLQHQARSEFSAVFSDVLSNLYLAHEEESGYARDLLQENFIKHYTAYQKLRGVLGATECVKLDNRWNLYVGDKKYNNPIERDLYRFCEVFNMDTTLEQNMAAINRINRLLMRET